MNFTIFHLISKGFAICELVKRLQLRLLIEIHNITKQNFTKTFKLYTSLKTILYFKKKNISSKLKFV